MELVQTHLYHKSLTRFKKDYIFPEELAYFPPEVINIISSFRICRKYYVRTTYDQSDAMRKYIFDIKVYLKYGIVNIERSNKTYIELYMQLHQHNYYVPSVFQKIRRNTEYNVMINKNIKNSKIEKELEDKGLNNWLEKRKMSLYNKHK